MKKKIFAIFATALLLALCAIPCFAYPSQNLTFGGLYQNDNVTPYQVVEFRSPMYANAYTTVYNSGDLSREISGFIVEVEIPFMSNFVGSIRMNLVEFYGDGTTENTISTYTYGEGAYTFYFVIPRRNIDHIHLYLIMPEDWYFSDEDASIVTTVYPISLNTDEIEQTAYNSGYQGGYNDGLVDGQEVTEDLGTFMVDIFGALAEFFTPLLSIEIWGINLMSVVSLLVLVSIAMIVLSLKK